jgi:predicted dehydrogenase
MSESSLKKIRAAVIGGGAFGECHLKTYRSMPQVEVAGLYTLEKDRAEALCRKYGGRRYESLQQLASDPDIDLVSIATPENAHFESFKLLAEKKKAIYVEKPLATSMEEAKQMLDLSRGIIAMCGHCLRFESRLAHVFQQREQLGKLHHMSFKDRRPRSQKALYGRVHPAYVMLCHEIELANAFAGVPFKRVCGMESHFSAGQIDGITMLIEYENGATCMIEGGFYLPSEDDNDLIALDFEKGTFTIALPHSGFNFVGHEGSKFVNQQYEYSVYGMEFGALRTALEYMTNCITQNTQPKISTIEDGYNAVRLAHSAIESARAGRWIERASI